MISNYFKIAWRNLIKNKFFSLINIFGLAIGLCSFLLISLYILDELSYDKHFKNADRIYRINSDILFGGTSLKLSQSSDPMGAVLKKDYHQVEQYTRIYTNEGGDFVRKGNQYVFEDRIAYADSTFFDMFSIPVIEGDPATALDAPNSVVINETMARKYFNSAYAVGKTLEFGATEKTIFTIKAVYKDIPENTHFNFDMIFSMDNVSYGFGNFLSHNFSTYIRLTPETDYRSFDEKFISVTDKYILPQAKQFMDINSMDDFKKSGNDLRYSLFPMKDIHLRSDRSFEINTGGNIQYIYIFGAVAIFLLIIACINFMNLSTARSSSRAKEVGIRKVLGTEKLTLIWQFIAESAMTSYIALLLAIIMIAVVLPVFNDISAKSIHAMDLFKVNFLPLLLLLPMLTGLLAGYYPAFFLSSFKPVEVLKSKLNAGLAGSKLRNILVVFQFAVSLILIISTIIVYQQLEYIQTKNIGFDKDQVLVLDETYALNGNQEAFKNDILQLAGVKHGSQSQYLPVSNSSRNDNTFSKEAFMTEKNGINMQVWKIDYDYIPTLGMELAGGRNFSKEFGADSNAVIINETTAKMLGYDDPVGKYIYTSDGNSSNQGIALSIIGVVKNFHFETLKEDIGPLCFRLGQKPNGMIFKISGASMAQIVSQIESKWKKMAPDMPFSYRFLDDSFDEMYRGEMRIGKVAMIFSFLTIMIACLGLFGLVTFMTEQRVKEIGIRKVLGANELSIIHLILKDFLKLVFISILIGSPLAYYFMHNWLQDFAYRINIEWWIFTASGFVAIVITLITVSYQAIKAALMNPVKSLKSE